MSDPNRQSHRRRHLFQELKQSPRRKIPRLTQADLNVIVGVASEPIGTER